MHQLVANLDEKVLPKVPLRQFVLSPPFGLVGLLGSNEDVLSKLCRIFVSAVEKRILRSAKEEGIVGARTGAVTFIQRFSNSLLLFPHAHVLFLDGVFTKDGDARPVFHPLKAPAEDTESSIADEVARRFAKFLKKKGFVSDDPEVEKTPAARWYGAVHRERAGFATLDENGDVERIEGSRAKRDPNAFSVHAKVRVAALDQEGRERILRYVTRPPLAEAQLSRTNDGRVAVELRKTHGSGATHVVLEPAALIRRLAWLVPPASRPQVRFSGVLSANSKWRKEIVPQRKVTPPKLTLIPGGDAPFRSRRDTPTVSIPDIPSDGGNSWIAWNELLKRVYDLDALQCPKCPGRLRPIALITDKAVARKILEHLDLPADVPRFTSSRAPP